MKAVAETIRERHGYINLLVNNAGLAKNFLPKLPGPGEVDMKKYQEMLWNAGSPQDFSAAFDVNVSAVWYTAVAFLDLLDAGNKRGNTPGVTSQILTVASGGAFRKDDKVFSVPYTLSKSAATHLGKMLAHFLKDWQIRSNVIAPGIFPSGVCVAFRRISRPCGLWTLTDSPRNGRRSNIRRVREGRCPHAPSGYDGRYGRTHTLLDQQGKRVALHRRSRVVVNMINVSFAGGSLYERHCPAYRRRPSAPLPLKLLKHDSRHDFVAAPGAHPYDYDVWIGSLGTVHTHLSMHRLSATVSADACIAIHTHSPSALIKKAYRIACFASLHPTMPVRRPISNARTSLPA